MYARGISIVSSLILFLLLAAGVVSAGEIHDAVDVGYLQMVTALIDGNIDLLNEQDIVEKTPLHHAIEAGHIEIAKFLIERGADINLLDKDRGSPLHAAASLGDVELVRLLIERGATSINEGDYRECTPLYIAAMMGHPDVARLLIESGADVDARDAVGRTPLMAVGSPESMEIVDVLLEGGADINATVSRGPGEYSVLTVCAMFGSEDLVNYLIDKGAVVHESTLESTFHSAVASDKYRLYEYLLEKGIDINEVHQKDPDFVFTAASGGSVRIMESLIEHGFNPGRRDVNGWAPLHYAASAGKTEMLTFLIGTGIDKNVRTMKGETAYHLAIASEENDAAEYLKEAGVDSSPPQFPELKGPYMGQTPPGDTPEMFLPGIVSGNYRAHSSLAFSPDGLQAYWTEMSPPEGRVMSTEMIDGVWSYPTPSLLGRDPSFSPDGQRLLYIQVRPFRQGERPAGERDGWECYWYRDRTESGWSEPIEVSDVVNSIGVHWPCSVDKTGGMYFSEFANNMYFSEYSDGEYHKPVKLTELFGNETLTGNSPFISPDGDYLLFSTDDGICISFRRDDGTWTDRTNLGDQINASAVNGSPRITPDGKYMFFVSAGDGRPWGIYWVSAGFIERLREEAGRDR